MTNKKPETIDPLKLCGVRHVRVGDDTSPQAYRFNFVGSSVSKGPDGEVITEFEYELEEVGDSPEPGETADGPILLGDGGRKTEKTKRRTPCTS